MRNTQQITLARRILRTTLFLFAAMLATMTGSGLLHAQTYHLTIGSSIVDCGQFAEVPIVFTQPETSSVTSITMEIAFPNVFEEAFYTPNDDRNRPQILRGAALASGTGLNFNMVSLQSTDNGGALIPGRWRIAIISPDTSSVPAGEIIRMRFYPKLGAAQGSYPISFASAGLYTSTGNPIQPTLFLNGSVTIYPCQYPTTTSASSTTTTSTQATTSTTLSPTSTSTTWIISTTTTWLPTTTTWFQTTTTTWYITTTTSVSTSTSTSSSSTSTSTSTVAPTTTTTLHSPTLLEFPQLAAGGGYRTFIYLSNPNNSTVQVATQLFNQQGASLTVFMNGQPTSYRIDNIAPYGSLNLRLEDSTANVKVGWTQIFSTKAITGVMVYQYIENGIIMSEATVFPSARNQRSLLMVPILGSATDTGLAIANPGDVSTVVNMRLLAANGVQVTSVQFTLGPKEQRSAFCSQYFNGIATVPEGTVEITTSQPFIGIGLAYQFQSLISGHDVFTTVPLSSIP